MRGHQTSVQIARSVVVSVRQSTLTTVLLKFYLTEKGQRRGYSQAVFWHNKMAAYANKVYVCLFVTKTMRMFIATALTVKRWWCEILSIFNWFLYVVCKGANLDLDCLLRDCAQAVSQTNKDLCGICEYGNGINFPDQTDNLHFKQLIKYFCMRIANVLIKMCGFAAWSLCPLSIYNPGDTLRKVRSYHEPQR